VAKILVADDNSNVQKTMALALAGLGVEVISVNNGEAAVRKLADVSPDLVLADIFMPVRNGYEVCEYIKNDARFSHVPVVLLVGAFDPFDEREAQRVGADGILKKPFVPPDPLITMVKSLLDKAMADKLVSVSASSVSEPPSIRSGMNTIVKVNGSAPAPAVEESQEEIPAAANRVSFVEGEHPVAFGELLEMKAQNAAPPAPAAVEPADNEQVLTSSRDATLGEPNFWRSDATKSDPEQTQLKDVHDGISLLSWQQDKSTLLRTQDDASSLPEIEPIDLVTEEPAETPSSLVDAQPVVLDPASQTPTSVDPDKPPELVTDAMEWLTTEAEHHAEVRVETAPELPEEIALSADPTPIEASEHEEPVQEEASVTKFATSSAEDTAHSIPKDKWAEMTETIEARASEIVMPHVDAPSVPAPADSASVPPVSSAVTVDTPKLPDAPMPSVRMPAALPEPNVPDPALVEAVVQRVLDKMRPQVVDIITKEFLRPVVQALVHREIEKR
jgi:CheY-like chemotaxis protein